MTSIITDDNLLYEECIFFKLPLYLYLNIDLEAVKRLVNLPDTSNLTPLTTFCFIKLRSYFINTIYIFITCLK